MAMNTQILPTDTRLTRWKRILTAYQYLPGAKRHNDPKRDEGLRRTLVKLLKSLNGV